MSPRSNDANAIACMVLTFAEDEISYVNEVLEESGYAGDLKGWILNEMRSTDEESEERSPYAGAADRVINNVSEFVKDNPETIRASVNLAGNILSRVMKKGPRV